MARRPDGKFWFTFWWTNLAERLVDFESDMENWKVDLKFKKADSDFEIQEFKTESNSESGLRP